MGAPSCSAGSTQTRCRGTSWRARKLWSPRWCGQQQAEFSSGRSERLGAACAKRTFAGGCRCQGQPAQPHCDQEQPVTCEPPRLPCWPALPLPRCPGLPGLQLHEGGCSSSATRQFSGKCCPKTQHYLGTRVFPLGPTASFRCCPTAPPSDRQAAWVPSPRSPARSQHDPGPIWCGGVTVSKA